VIIVLLIFGIIQNGDLALYGLVTFLVRVFTAN